MIFLVWERFHSVVVRNAGVESSGRRKTFVVDGANSLAVAAAEGAAVGFPDADGPLVLYGAPGTGKTHLLHAVANAVTRREPGAAVVLAQAGEAIPAPSDRALVLVDDLAEAHAGWLEEIAGGPPSGTWCLAATGDPRRWGTLGPASAAWLATGRSVDLGTPTTELLEALVARRTEDARVRLEPGEHAFLLEHFSESPGRLTAALERLLSHKLLGTGHEGLAALAAYIHGSSRPQR